MINFFRKSRKKLADDNKYFKYSRYAIGEIVLVVIGILIALSINNWNENNKRAKFEQESLINLKQDFVYNRNALAKVIEENSVNMKSGILILNHTGRRFKSNFEIDSILDNLASSSLYFPKNG